jgi:hypothetical protein
MCRSVAGGRAIGGKHHPAAVRRDRGVQIGVVAAQRNALGLAPRAADAMRAEDPVVFLTLGDVPEIVEGVAVRSEPSGEDVAD